jgi:lysophospholipase L1-like esterase
MASNTRMSAFRFIRPFSAFAAILLCSLGSPVLHAQKAKSIPEEIEWTWEVRPPHPDAKLPNVLLLGDSITRAYFPQAVKDLTGTANVYLMASSTSVGDPRLPRQIAEFATMEGVTFRVVHFNNGMHGWAYTEAEYKTAFPSFLHAIKRLVVSKDAMIWATTTPVRADATGGANNSRVDARNDIANSFVKSAGVVIDDQHALMMKHQDLHQDPVHFQPSGAALQGDQAAATIKTALAHMQQ